MKILFLCSKLSAKRYKSKTILQGNDFIYVAIHCNLLPYELVWQISRVSSLQFVCEPKPFVFSQTNPPSKHILYYYAGMETIPRTWLVQNQGTAHVLTTSKPQVDYWLVWENDDEININDFWISLLKDKGLAQMAYLYPQERSHKITWGFDLPHLIPNH
jgi:hypothetical protein